MDLPHRGAASPPNDAIGELVRFALLAIGGTAALHLSLPAFGLRFSLSPTSAALYLYLAGLAMPSLAALLLCRSGTRRAFCRSVLTPRGSPVTYAAALLGQAGIVALAWLLLAATGAPARPRVSLDAGFALLVAGQIWVVLGEEPGWRGFALPRLESVLSPRLATLALACIWGVWHVPMFLVADSLQAGSSPWLFASSIFAWSAVHSALYRRTRPGILPNLIFHGCANITLNLGLVPAELETYLLASYILMGAAAWISLASQGSTRASPG